MYGCFTEDRQTKKLIADVIIVIYHTRRQKIADALFSFI